MSYASVFIELVGFVFHVSDITNVISLHFRFFCPNLIGRAAGIGSPDCTARRLGFGRVVLGVVFAFALALGARIRLCGITLTTRVLGVTTVSASKSAGCTSFAFCLVVGSTTYFLVN